MIANDDLTWIPLQIIMGDANSKFLMLKNILFCLDFSFFFSFGFQTFSLVILLVGLIIFLAALCFIIQLFLMKCCLSFVG